MLSIAERINSYQAAMRRRSYLPGLESGCEILILNHPTRGVDVGSKEEIYDLVRDMTAEGHSIILLGDTLDECIGLSSRIIVLRDGLIRGSFECPVGNKPLQLDIVQQMM